MTRWIFRHLGPDVPLHFTAFHPDWKMTDKPPTPVQTLQRSREIALGNGLRYVYTGNVHDFKSSSTYCHQCGATLVGRDWYVLSDWGLDVHAGQAACRYCGSSVAGLFDEQPGTWGARRQPVRITAV